MLLDIPRATLSSYPHLKTEVQISQPSKLALKTGSLHKRIVAASRYVTKHIAQPQSSSRFLDLSPGGRGWWFRPVSNTSLCSRNTFTHDSTTQHNPPKMSTRPPTKKSIPAKPAARAPAAKKPVPQPVRNTTPKPAAARAPAARAPAARAPAAANKAPAARKAPVARAAATRAPARPAAPKQEPAKAGNWINRTVQGGVASVGNYAGALVGGVGNSVNGIGAGIGSR
jgi:hypothetical protein